MSDMKGGREIVRFTEYYGIIIGMRKRVHLAKKVNCSMQETKKKKQ